MRSRPGLKFNRESRPGVPGPMKPGSEFERIIRANGWFMDVLAAVRACDPPSWLVGAGVIRNIVWDYLHGRKEPTPVKDVDVAFFDPDNLSPERDAEVQNILRKLRPDIPWEATNQAAVHLWFESVFGYAVPPLHSCEEAVATWPETVTSIGVRLRKDGSLYIVAPFGFEDLFGLVLRRNPARVTPELYRRRAVEKGIARLWPKVKVIDG